MLTSSKVYIIFVFSTSNSLRNIQFERLGRVGPISAKIPRFFFPLCYMIIDVFTDLVILSGVMD